MAIDARGVESAGLRREDAVHATRDHPAAARASARSRRFAQALLLALGALAAAAPALAFLRPRRGDPLLYELGRGAALLAFGLLTLQVVLAARLPVADRALGLGAIMRLHRAVGVLALALLLAHPALILAASRGRIPWEWPVAVGAGALLVLVLGVLAALLFRWLRLDYNRWRTVHKAMILVVVLGYVHSRAAGEDLQSSPALRAWWTALLAVAIGVFLWRNALAPRWGRRRFRVASIAAEARGVWTVRLAAEDGPALRYSPGQFMFLTLLRDGLPVEEHPFTISSSPTDPACIAATIKESGDYTRTVGRTRVGDRALVEGPFGRFSLLEHPAGRFVLVSAGVGCTPMMSMLRYLRDVTDPRPVLYLCANRAEADIAFRDELEAMPPSVKVVHVLSRPGESWRGLRGHLDEATLRAVMAGSAWIGAAALVCGPPPFMREVSGALRRLGLPRARIHAERFTVP